MKKQVNVAIVGATGAVGVEIQRCLAQRKFPLSGLKLLASARSVGKKANYCGRGLMVEELKPESFRGVDIALFSAGGEISRQYAPIAAESGCVVVDNSSVFRQEADVPLVVPEINAQAVYEHPRNIIANPNCTTIITLMALYPLHRRFGLRRIVASSYQAVSGSGQRGIEELENQIRAYVNGESIEVQTYPRQIAFNVLPQIDRFTDTGYTKEELKMLNEGRKILGLPRLRVSCTCVRVPVFRSHSVACVAQFERPVDVEAARRCYDGMPGVALMDEPAREIWPTPLDSTGGDTCYVGRIRKDMALRNALSLWVVGDQLRKGAALNAVQIAELLVRRETTRD